MGAETIRDVVINLKLKTDIPDSPTTIDLSAAREEVARFEDSLSDVVQNVGDTASDAAKEATTAAKQAADAVDKIADAQEALTDANAKVFESFKAVGEGAFTFARGVALSLASTEEEAAKILKTIARVQGAFDVFKGTTEVIRSVVEAKKALAAATAAATLATELSAAADAKETATSLANAAANRAQGAAKGGGVGAAVGAAALGPVGIAAAVGAAAGAYIMADARAMAAEFHEKFSSLFAINVRATITDYVNDTIDTQDIGAITEQAAEFQRKIEDGTLSAAVQKELFAGINDLLAERNRLANEEFANKQKALSLQEKELQNAKAILEAEEQRKQTQEESLGRLGREEKQELGRFLEKIEGGEELSRSERERFEAVGGQKARDYTSDKWREEGRATGFGERLDRIPGGESVEELPGRAGFGLEYEGETELQEVTRKIKELQAAMKESAEAQKAAYDAMKQEQDDLKRAAYKAALDAQKDQILAT